MEDTTGITTDDTGAAAAAASGAAVAPAEDNAAATTAAPTANNDGATEDVEMTEATATETKNTAAATTTTTTADSKDESMAARPAATGGVLVEATATTQLPSTTSQAVTTTAQAATTTQAATSSATAVPVSASGTAATAPRVKKKKKRVPKDSKGSDAEANAPRRKKIKKKSTSLHNDPQMAAQLLVNEQMRRVLEEDRYSAVGSIVEEPDSDAEDYLYRGHAGVRLDRPALQQAVKKYLTRTHQQRLLWEAGGEGGNAKYNPDLDGMGGTGVGAGSGLDNSTHGGGGGGGGGPSDSSHTATSASTGTRKKKTKPHDGDTKDGRSSGLNPPAGSASLLDPLLLEEDAVDLDRDGGSIFGQTTGSSNATWVQCDKCKKWRRLRGVVDEKKLPKQWFCSMNKTDPERARCSAPEEDYNETTQTQSPESLADMKARKHFRVWVRRLQCNEAYEARQPTQTRGKKKAAAASSSKENPYEWVRCCNPSCGKWRAILRIMDARSSVMDRATDGEWYCVMNTWDEKMASCAAPQENLPAIGCPPWVMQD